MLISNSEGSKRIGVVGCKHTTLELMQGLDRHGFKIDHCLTIRSEEANKNKVAGYLDMRDYLTKKIDSFYDRGKIQFKRRAG